MLTWRGVIPLLPGALAAPSLVLALDQGDRKKTWAKALSELDNAAWTTASGPDDASEAPGRAPLLVLGGLRGALASFEARRPPGRP
jgi:hypothetical protein